IWVSMSVTRVARVVWVMGGSPTQPPPSPCSPPRGLLVPVVGPSVPGLKVVWFTSVSIAQPPCLGVRPNEAVLQPNIRIIVTPLLRENPTPVIMGDIDHVQPHGTRERTAPPELVQLAHVIGLGYLLPLRQCCLLCYGPRQALAASALWP